MDIDIRPASRGRFDVSAGTDSDRLGESGVQIDAAGVRLSREAIMAEIDPTTDRAAAAVLAAFEAAQRDDLSSVDCYRAGVEAWQHAHPDQRREYAARQAVAVILAAKVKLRIDDA
jgi:hypothetical protein